MDDYSDAFVKRSILKRQLKREAKEKEEANMLSIYAELSQKTLKDADNLFSSLPEGVDLTRKQGSRACYFECDDSIAKEELIDLLDMHRILWQEN